MLKVSIAFILALFLTLPARAEPVYFVAFAQIQPEKQEQYDQFVKGVVPVWNRHGMTVMTRMRTVDGFGNAEHQLAPTELLLLRAETREGFQNYLRDADYRKISNLRIDAVNQLIILEAELLTSQRMKFFPKQPMRAFIFSDGAKTASQANLLLKVTLAATVKGDASDYLKSVKTLEVFGISFDDNPTQYMNAEGGMQQAAFIGEAVK